MPTNILVLPLLAGFLFSHFCYYTKYRAQSLDGYRLLLEATCWAVIFLIASRAGILVIRCCPAFSPLESSWTLLAPFPYSGTATCSLIISVVAAAVVNRIHWTAWRCAARRKRLLARLVRVGKTELRSLRQWTPQQKERRRRHRRTMRSLRQNIALNWATARQKNQLLVLFNEAAQSSQMLSITLKSRKFYVGFLRTAPSLDPHETYFRFYPVLSGFRESSTLTFQITTDYAAVGQQTPISVVLPINEIQSASRFDLQLYKTNFQQHSEDETPMPLGVC